MKMRRIRGKDMSMIFQEPMTSLNPVLTIGYQIRKFLYSIKIYQRRRRFKTIDMLELVRIPLPERVNNIPIN